MKCKTCEKDGFYVAFHNMPPGTNYIEYLKFSLNFECSDCFNKRLKDMNQMLEELIEKEKQNAFGEPHLKGGIQ
jgi:hypothetical protein